MREMVEYDGINNEDIGLLVAERINIPYPEDDIEEIVVPGRDGALHKDNKRKKPITIPVVFNYIGREEDWNEIWHRAKKWLSKKNKRLVLNTDAGKHFKVYYAEVSENEKLSFRIGRFTANFHCHPYRYLESGEEEIELEFEPYYILDSEGNEIADTEYNSVVSTMQYAEINNPYEKTMPIYRIKGSGKCEFSVNGKPMEAEVKAEITIDCERQVAFKERLVSANADITGRYDDVALEEGKNKIEKTEFFDISVEPIWRQI